MAAQQDERLVLKNPRLYFGFDSLQWLEIATLSWRSPGYKHRVLEKRGVSWDVMALMIFLMLGFCLAWPILLLNSCLDTYLNTLDETPQPLPGFLQPWGLGFWLVFSYSFCFILNFFFWVQHNLPSPRVHFGARSFPLIPSGCSNDSRTVFPNHLEGEYPSSTGSAGAASETFKQGWE